METKIMYQKKNVYRGIFFGCLMLLSSVFLADDVMISNFFLPVFLTTGFTILIISLYRNFKPYLKISDDYIEITEFLPVKIPISDIQSIDYFAGEYILRTRTKEHRINKDYIEPDNISSFEEMVSSLKNTRDFHDVNN